MADVAAPLDFAPSSSMAGGAKKARKPTARKPASKKPASKKGGAFANDVKNLAIPFALSLLTKSVQSRVDKKKGGGDEAAEQLVAGGGKKAKKPAAKKPAAKKASKQKIAKIKAEFMDITQAIHSFLAKY